MTTRPSRLGRPKVRLAARAVAVAVFVVSPAAHGEDDRVVDEQVANAAETSGRVIMYDLGENFTWNVISRHEGFSLAANPGRTAPTAVSSADADVRAIVEQHFKQIMVMVDMSDSQARKLRLAMELDVRRIVDEIDTQRHRYRGVVVSGNWHGDPRQQQTFQQWQHDVQRSRDLLKQVCGGDSLLAKALPTTLDAEQHARLVAAVDDRLSYLWRAIVAGQMVAFDGSLGLDERQHEALEALLVEAQPDLQHSLGTVTVKQARHYDAMLTGLALEQIGGQRLRTAVSGRQAQALEQFARQCAMNRGHLEAHGLIKKKVH